MAAKQIKEISVNVGEVSKQYKNLNQELAATKKELQNLAEAGQQSSKRFSELEQRAGQVRDRIGDINARIKVLSSDTPKLDLLVGAARGIAGGFALAQGAVALFGKENEALNKTLQKVQGSIALLNGLQEVANLLNKDNVVGVNLKIAAQKAYTFAVGESTAAISAFRLALISIGVGAVIAGVALLVTYWEDISKFIGLSNDELDKQPEKVQLIIDKLLTEKELRLEIAKARGDQQKLDEIEIENLQKQIVELEKYILTNENYLKTSANASQKNIDYANNEIKIAKQKIQIINAQIEGINKKNKSEKDTNKILDEQKKKLEEINNLYKNLRLTIVSEINKLSDKQREVFGSPFTQGFIQNQNQLSETYKTLTKNLDEITLKFKLLNLEKGKENLLTKNQIDQINKNSENERNRIKNEINTRQTEIFDLEEKNKILEIGRDQLDVTTEQYARYTLQIQNNTEVTKKLKDEIFKLKDQEVALLQTRNLNIKQKEEELNLQNKINSTVLNSVKEQQKELTNLVDIYKELGNALNEQLINKTFQDIIDNFDKTLQQLEKEISDVAGVSIIKNNEQINDLLFTRDNILASLKNNSKEILDNEKALKIEQDKLINASKKERDEILIEIARLNEEYNKLSKTNKDLTEGLNEISEETLKIFRENINIDREQIKIKSNLIKNQIIYNENILQELILKRENENLSNEELDILAGKIVKTKEEIKLLEKKLEIQLKSEQSQENQLKGLSKINQKSQEFFQRYQEEIQIIVTSIQVIGDVVAAQFDFRIAKLNQEIDLMNERYDRELELIQRNSEEDIKRVNNSLLSEEVKQSEIARLREERANDELVNENRRRKEQEKLERQRNKLGQRSAISQAVIGASLAIIQSFAQLGPIAGAIAAAGIAVTTGLQIATIKRQKFERGGKLQRGGKLEGASHAQGGIPINISGGNMVEAEGGEAIINRKSTERFAPLLSAINSFGGWGERFQRGGITGSNPSQTNSDVNLVNIDELAQKIGNQLNMRPMKTYVVAQDVQNEAQISNQIKAKSIV
jgi:hypothetical protein